LALAKTLSLADFADYADLKIMNANICANPCNPWEINSIGVGFNLPKKEYNFKRLYPKFISRRFCR